jgi:hypothetical protein
VDRAEEQTQKNGRGAQTRRSAGALALEKKNPDLIGGLAAGKLTGEENQQAQER